MSKAIASRPDAGFTLRRYIHLLDDDLPDPSAIFAFEGASEMPARGDEIAREGQEGETEEALQIPALPRAAEIA